MAKSTPTYKSKAPSPRQISTVPTSSTSSEEAKQRVEHAFARIEGEFSAKAASPSGQNFPLPPSSTSLEEANQRFEKAIARVEVKLHVTSVWPCSRQASSPQRSSASLGEAMQKVANALVRVDEAFQKVVYTTQSHEVQLLRIKSEVRELKKDGEEKKSQIWLLQMHILRLEEKVRCAMEVLEE